MSAADTPHGKSSPSLTRRELAAVDGVLQDVEAANKSSPDITITTTADVDTPPAVFGAGGPMYAPPASSPRSGSLTFPESVGRLKQFDQSNATSRIMSQASTPRSVVGIGGKGMLSTRP